MKFFRDDDNSEELEELIDAGHCCDERCEKKHHDDHNTPTGLAPEGAGWRGISGSGEQVSRELWKRADAAARAAGRGIDETSRIYRELLAAWQEEHDTRIVIWEAQQAANRAARRFERRRAAAVRRAQPRVDRRSPNRPTRVDVHPDAWSVLKRQAIAKGIPVADAVGTLLVFAPLPETATACAGVAKRFARLFIDEDDWRDVRGRAVSIGVSTARLIGLIVEAEARRGGWMPEGER